MVGAAPVPVLLVVGSGVDGIGPVVAGVVVLGVDEEPVEFVAVAVDMPPVLLVGTTPLPASPESSLVPPQPKAVTTASTATRKPGAPRPRALTGCVSGELANKESSSRIG
jgi:hypothetical protein